MNNYVRNLAKQEFRSIVETNEAHELHLHATHRIDGLISAGLITDEEVQEIAEEVYAEIAEEN